jgi:alanyl aminopeptidase
MKTKQLCLTALGLALWLSAIILLQAAETPPAPKLRLGDQVRPISYAAELAVIPEQSNFTGQITIELNFAQTTSFFWLHGHGLSVTSAYLEQRGRQIPARPIVGSEEFLGFYLQQPASGKARLLLSYSGVISEKEFSGLFRRQEEGNWYAATQMEATWARRVFPCFDEPAFKVPWRVTLHVKREQVAISNSPLVSETDEPGGMKCVRFAPTPPLPSYLLAVAVGPFEIVDLGKVGRKRTPVRIFTVKGKTNEAVFAAQAIPELLRRLEDYYDLPYPYPKLDQLAMPQFQGAMENAGLIIHDETILLSPPDRQTIQFRRLCANVCTHEMAHQWFGDLVTMSWWDDIWLNEAFATWISPKIVDSWKPEWRTGLDQLLDTFGAVGADSLSTARCIRQPIQSGPDIDNAFDGITYDKGAAVLGMFESRIGPETFRKAIRTYLQSHSWKTATTADFLASLNKQAGKDIGASFSTFLDQSGVPLVSAEPNTSSDGALSVRLSQKRYLPVGSSGDVHREWKIPMHLRYQGREREERLTFEFNHPQETVNLKTAAEGLRWFLLNQGEAGYYVSAYRGQLLTNLLGATATKLSPAERLGVAHSISAAVRSGDVPLGEALSLEPTLLMDPERRVVTMAAGFMNVRDRVPPELRPNYERFIRKSLEPLINNVSWQSPPGETDDQRLQRLALLSLAANAGEDPRLKEEAKRLALTWLQDRKSVPADEADAVLQVAGKHADGELVEKLLKEARKAQEASDRELLIAALGSTRDTNQVRRVLDALTNREFRPADSTRLLFTICGHIETESVGYDYLKEHYVAVTAALPNDSVFAYLPNLARGFDTPERQADVEAFFKDKDVKLTGGPRIIAQVIESIHLNQAFKEAQVPSLVEFLKAQ